MCANAAVGRESKLKNGLLWSSRMRTLPRCDLCAKRFEQQSDHFRKNEQGQYGSERQAEMESVDGQRRSRCGTEGTGWLRFT